MLAAVMAAVLFPTAGMSQTPCADLALVLAIDASGSVKDNEFALQRQGYAEAFRSPLVQAALSDAGVVDIGAVLFSDSERKLSVLPMTRLVGGAGAGELARRLDEMPRPLPGNTGIGTAIIAALGLLDGPGACAQRRLIDVSGDGPESMAPRTRSAVSTAAARQRAEELGITINALAIRSDVPDLDQWYETRLITGPGAFVMRVDSFESFAEAIVEKLVREIGPPQLASVDAAEVLASRHVPLPTSLQRAD
jgi:hypothetical protein